jgi:signal transduction histidine kinase
MPNVLLVDDEPSIRLTMGEFLRRAGYSVLIAADYDSAVTHKPEDLDVAVIDINLPGKSGIQLLQKLSSARTYLPVIMITGEPNMSVIPEIIRAGAYDFIAKPITKDVLLNVVGRAAEKKRLTDDKSRLEQEIKKYAEELELRVDERTAELIDTHKRLVTQERIAALGRAAAQVAHEVKNPLAGLLLYSLHLKEKSSNFSESQTYLVDKIIDTIRQLNNRVQQILGFARPVSLSLHSEDLNKIVADILELLRPQLEANQVEVRLSIGEQATHIMLDETSMRGALMNLLLNAIEAMPNGGMLSIAVNQSDEMLQLEIADTGHGIAEDEVKKIFEPFFTTKEQGLGLGMPYAKKIIDQHGGKISINSELGKGTRISIVLPTVQKEVDDAA